MFYLSFVIQKNSEDIQPNAPWSQVTLLVKTILKSSCYIIYDMQINMYMYIQHVQNDSNEGYVIVELSCTILSFRRIWSLAQWHNKVSNLNDITKKVHVVFISDRIDWPEWMKQSIFCPLLMLYSYWHNVSCLWYSLWYYKNDLVSSLSCNVRYCINCTWRQQP